MIRLNIHEAKTHLSRHLKKLEEGEVIVLCKRNVPIAEIRPLAPRREGERPIGLAEGTFQVPSSFFDPLPDDLLDAFDGGPATT
jgi:antitoxin (DNA-binding transcriptional repressor) of toxin-antitoxin stability system